ncbi:sporulation integral membrane protein YtvI [Virgibacillus sp. 179-BFC.A HS]|uniref:Sporulation integral membrane protein YtvI n=1 Tax=Tigheibacillus jepli TaxID=3035914 RepID=A0ABU5CGA8_9BACI|nr:sporulation integral membrane protein YtvI [Virgibacillus sp. 179-BFC.A HS]MDY0405354.1 sporulation integral membrane protein YtvI [Virgibacillus sp. 179-BFC.A HS]
MSKHLLMQAARAAIVCICLFGIYYAVKLLATYAYPFLIALLLAFLLHPIVSFMEVRLKLPRMLATVVTMVGVFAFVSLFVFVLFAELTQGMLFLADQIPAYYESIIAFLREFTQVHLLPLYDKFFALFQRLEPTQQETIEEYLQQASSYAATYGANILQQFFLKLTGIAVMLPTSISVMIFIILATFFMTNDWNKLMTHTKFIFPYRMHGQAKSLTSHFKKGLSGYLKAQLLLVTTSAVIIFAGLLILHINHALTITFLAAFADLLPLLGTGIVFIPWIIYLLFTDNTTLSLALLLLYLFVVLTRQVMEPKVLSSSLGISPLLSLIVLFLAIKIYGAMGLIMTPVILILFAGMMQARVFHAIYYFIKGTAP